MPALRTRVLSLAFLAGITAPYSGAAQTHIELGPSIAGYAPLGRFAPANAYSPILPSNPSALSALAWGAQGRLWLNSRFAVQVRASVASSRWWVCSCAPEGLGDVLKRAQVLAATAEVLYRVGGRRVAPWVSAGAGIVRRTGEAYADAGTGAPISAAGTFGLGLDIGLFGRLTATAGASGLFYWLDAADREGTVQHGFQTDLLAHVGLLWRVN